MSAARAARLQRTTTLALVLAVMAGCTAVGTYLEARADHAYIPAACVQFGTVDAHGNLTADGEHAIAECEREVGR